MLLHIASRHICLKCISQLISTNKYYVLRISKSSTFIKNVSSVSHLHTGARLMEDLPDTSKPGAPPPPPPRREAVGKRFKWENRTRTATAIMVLWAIGVVCIVILQRSNRKEKRHQLMLDQSLDLMSDSNKKKMENMLTDTALPNSSKVKSD